MKRYITASIRVIIGLFALAACQPQVEEQGMVVHLIIDELERAFVINEAMTVEEFLAEAGAELDDNDRLNPPAFTQLTDGLRVTIVRVDEETVCERQPIPYEEEIVLNEAFAPGEERISQVGQSGEQEVCFRVISENGAVAERVQVGQPQTITAPVSEIRIVGVNQDVEPVPIEGTLAYINGGNAWVMDGNSTTKRILTSTSDLDSHVLSLSPDSRYLIYTREPSEPDAFVNELWLIDTVGDKEPVQLEPTDVLFAEWLTNEDDTISYSTSEVQNIEPFWNALNNVWTMRVDPISGNTLNIRQIVPENSGGLSGWWGTVYRWSPDGEKLAWVRADSAGIIGDSGEFVTLVEYPSFRVLQNWSWRTDISWSWDSTLLALTVHGPPIGNQPADRSPVFNVSVADVTGAFEAKVIDSAGMWSAPRFSPPVDTDAEFPRGYLAYLQARDPFNSVNGEYDLMVADRDGSNARHLFPSENRVGIRSQVRGVIPYDYVWSPDGQQIALTYQGNLWIVNVETAVAHQLTFDGGATHPVWSR